MATALVRGYAFRLRLSSRAALWDGRALQAVRHPAGPRLSHLYGFLPLHRDRRGLPDGPCIKRIARHGLGGGPGDDAGFPDVLADGRHSRRRGDSLYDAVAPARSCLVGGRSAHQRSGACGPRHRGVMVDPDAGKPSCAGRRGGPERSCRLQQFLRRRGAVDFLRADVVVPLGHGGEITDCGRAARPWRPSLAG